MLKNGYGIVGSHLFDGVGQLDPASQAPAAGPKSLGSNRP
jgi:hypothetical protein